MECVPALLASGQPCQDTWGDCGGF
jgi:hypothetical protein